MSETVLKIMNPNAGRAIITNEGSRLRVEIPATIPWFATAFLGVWLIGWAFGEVTAISQVLSPSNPGDARLFLVVWLCAWTIGGGYALLILLWSLFGREIVELDQASLRYHMQIFGIGRTKQYETAHIANLRYKEPADSGAYARNNAIPKKVITFDFGKSQHAFGMGLDEPEAKLIIAEMTKKVRSMAGNDG